MKELLLNRRWKINGLKNMEKKKIYQENIWNYVLKIWPILE